MTKFLVALILAVIGLAISGYGIYRDPKGKLNYLIGAISIIIAIVFGIPDSTYPPRPTPEHTSAISTSTSPSPPSTPTPSSEQIPVPYTDNPKTIYGVAYKDEQANGQHYSLGGKIRVISDTYYGRKDENKEYKDGYYSKSNSNNATGYRLGFYYADDMIYYAEALIGKDIQVKMYFWGGEMIACNDLRTGDKSLYYAGTSEFEDVYEEFSYVYEIGMNT